MALQVTQDWSSSRFRFVDPSVLLSCDNPDCDSAWLTSDGLLCWAVSRTGPEQSLFVDRILFACDLECLTCAQQSCRWRHQRWSEPAPIATWIREMVEALTTDPTSTGIGDLRPQYSARW